MGRGKAWKPEELALVGKLLVEGKSLGKVATAVKRPYASIRKAAKRLRAGQTGLAKQREPKARRMTNVALDLRQTHQGVHQC